MATCMKKEKNKNSALSPQMKEPWTGPSASSVTCNTLGMSCAEVERHTVPFPSVCFGDRLRTSMVSRLVGSWTLFRFNSIWSCLCLLRVCSSDFPLLGNKGECFSSPSQKLQLAATYFERRQRRECGNIPKTSKSRQACETSSVPGRRNKPAVC